MIVKGIFLLFMVSPILVYGVTVTCSQSGDCTSGSACFSDIKGTSNGSCALVDASGCSSNHPAGLGSSCSPSKCFKNNITAPAPFCLGCCIPGLVYSLYNCSPPFQNDSNHAVLLYISESAPNTVCSGAPLTSSQLLVTLATGWIHPRLSELCMTAITITAPNGKSIVAKVGGECFSDRGCDSNSSYLSPCAPNAVGGTVAVWEKLGYDPQQHLGAVEDIQWSIATQYTPGATSDKKAWTQSTVGILASGLILGGLLISLGLILGWFLWRRKITRDRLRKQKEEKLVQEMKLELLPHQFSYKDLQTATQNFAESLKLGQGGFGTVFKGELSDGSLVAVKRMDSEFKLDSSDGHSQFKAEVLSIGSIHHCNLVRLRGFCLHGTKSMLVYEFMANGSLDAWIFDNRDNLEFLDWGKRYSIAVDVAKGLFYLHEGCVEQVLHLDIKPQNILLDENMSARISDFGLSKLSERGKSQMMTSVMGTPGYMGPEWLSSTKVTDKTDVYSFGMVMLVLVTSKKALQIDHDLRSFSTSKSTSSEVDQLSHLGSGESRSNTFQMHSIMEIVDSRLFPGLNVQEAERFITIGLWCTRTNPTERPSMGNVLNMLQGCMVVPELPAPADTSRSSFYQSRW